MFLFSFVLLDSIEKGIIDKFDCCWWCRCCHGWPTTRTFSCDCSTSRWHICWNWIENKERRFSLFENTI